MTSHESPPGWNEMTANRSASSTRPFGPGNAYGPNFHQVQLRVVLVPILSCIFGFPVLVLLIICGLRYRARRARKLASKRFERSDTSVGRGPAIVINGCEDDDYRTQEESFTDRRKIRLLSVRFKPLADLEEERSDIDMELTSDFILTPEDSSVTFS